MYDDCKCHNFSYHWRTDTPLVRFAGFSHDHGMRPGEVKSATSEMWHRCGYYQNRANVLPFVAMAVCNRRVLHFFSLTVSISVPGKYVLCPSHLEVRGFYNLCVTPPALSSPPPPHKSRHRWALNTEYTDHMSAVEVEGEGSARPLWHFSHPSGSADPALVPAVCRPSGNETQVHVEHFPVYWICRRAGPDQGEDATANNDSRQLTPVSCSTTGWKLNPYLISPLISCSSTISLHPWWNTSPHPAVKVRPTCLQGPFPRAPSLSFPPFLSCRKPHISHLPEERNMLRHRLG